MLTFIGTKNQKDLGLTEDYIGQKMNEWKNHLL